MSYPALDEQWIPRIAQGDGEAFRKVYEATISVVYGFTLSILRNREDAEDATHDTYLRIHRSAGDYRPMGRPLAWILTIARNVCFNLMRSRPRLVALDQVPESGDRGTGPGTADDVQTRLLLDAAIRLLDETECQIILLHALSGWKHRETAEFLGLPLSTVLSKYRRGIEKMRRVLEENERDA